MSQRPRGITTTCVHDFDQLYQEYQAAPGPETLNKIVHAAQPMIRYSLASVNALDNPKLKAQAKLFTVEAVQKYDPTRGAALRTHIGNNLMQIRRAAREASTPVRVPERAQLEMGYLKRKELEFRDVHGRDPDINELADQALMSRKKIEQLRNVHKTMPTEGALGGAQGEAPAYLEDAMSYVYHDADFHDRKILEHRGGYGGSELLPPNILGTQLGLTPSQLSRRSAKLAMKIHEITNMFESS